MDSLWWPGSPGHKPSLCFGSAGPWSWGWVPLEQFCLPSVACGFSPLRTTLQPAEAWSCRKMLNLPAVYSHYFLWPGQQLGGRVETVKALLICPPGAVFPGGDEGETKKHLYLFLMLTNSPARSSGETCWVPGHILPLRHRVMGLLSWGSWWGCCLMLWSSMHVGSDCICFSSS